MARMKVERLRIGAPRGIAFDKQAFSEVGEVVVGSTIKNILKQRTATGGKLKENEPATQERKRSKGRPLLSLVDAKRRLVKPKSYRIRAGRKFVEITFTAKQKTSRIARWVQERGYVGWFGLHKSDIADVRSVMAEAVNRIKRRVQNKRKRMG